MKRALYRNALIMLAAVVAVVLLHEVDRRAAGGLFEVDSPTFFARLEPLWRLLACTVPGVAVGFLITRRPALIGAIVYGIGAVLSFSYHGGKGSIALGNFLPERQFILPIIREWAVFVAIGLATGAYGAWLKRRFQLQRNSHYHKSVSGRSPLGVASVDPRQATAALPATDSTQERS